MSNAVQRIEVGWNDFWFQPEPAQALGACRILFYGGLFVMCAGADFTPLCRVAEAFWQPVSFYSLIFPQGPLSAAATSWMQLIWKISLLMSAAGLLTRVSTIVSGVLGLYLIGLGYNFGHLDHAMALAGIVLIMLPFSSCGKVWSLDRLLAQKRGNFLPTLSGHEARWPIQFVRVALSLVLFSAGLNKLRTSGLDWITTDTFQNYLFMRETPIGLRVAQWPLLCHFMAGFAVTTEFFHPLALVSKKLARVWVPAGLAVFTGIYLTMDIHFVFLMYLHFFWLPWHRLFVTTPRRVGA